MATHLHIIGLVQGVGYRASFEARARVLLLSGWVRNRADGSVEAVVQGAPEAVEQIVAWSKRGPSAAHVKDVIVNDATDASVIEGRFEVRPTA
jgi:acylphosphatase